MREIHHSGIRSETQKQLRGENSPMPFMQTEIQRIDFAEREEEHKENQPRERRSKRQEEFIAESTDEHGNPEGVGIKPFFHLVIYHLVIYLVISPFSHFLIYHLVIYLVISPLGDDGVHDSEDFGDGFGAEKGDTGLFEIRQPFEDRRRRKMPARMDDTFAFVVAAPLNGRKHVFLENIYLFFH